MRYTYGSPKLLGWGNDGKCYVGHFCSIAYGVEIFLGGNHRTDWASTYPFGHIHTDVFPYENTGHPASKGDVVINNDVWVGAKSTIMSGVTIGNGAVIAACSVVTKDVPDYCIVAGNPAKVVKKRFTDEQIAALLENPWWELPDEEIQGLIPLLCSDDIDGLITQLRQRQRLA